MRAHNFHSLILVTANYHMRRSLSAFAADMPKVTLIPYPVEPEGVNFAHWWRDPRTVRLLHAEYAKFLLSVVLDRVLPRPVVPHRKA
jgi:uncharacterized SAM-binding protein YcdF (DUF218 family)